MTFDDLKAKTDDLLTGRMSLDAFRAWYSFHTKPADTAVERTQHGFADYRYEPLDDDMRRHHNDLMGDGEME